MDKKKIIAAVLAVVAALGGLWVALTGGETTEETPAAAETPAAPAEAAAPAVETPAAPAAEGAPAAEVPAAPPQAP